MDLGRVAEDAWAYYTGLTDLQRQAAGELFEEMDADHNGSISIREFMDFLDDEGYQSANYHWLFEELDGDGNGALDFQELVTFFYMLGCERYRELMNIPASTEAPRGQRRPGDEGRRRNRDRLVGLLGTVVTAFHCTLLLAQLIVQ